MEEPFALRTVPRLRRDRKPGLGYGRRNHSSGPFRRNGGPLCQRLEERGKGSCGLLPTHSPFCIYRFFRVAEMGGFFFRFAGFCPFKTAKKRQDFRNLSSRIATAPL